MTIDSEHYLKIVRQILLPLPGIEEYICFNTPAFRVKKKLVARMKEDGETIAVHADDRDIWMNADSNVFFITDHYRNASMVLVRLALVSTEVLREVLIDAWRQVASKKLLREFEEREP